MGRGKDTEKGKKDSVESRRDVQNKPQKRSLTAGVSPDTRPVKRPRLPAEQESVGLSPGSAVLSAIRTSGVGVEGPKVLSPAADLLEARDVSGRLAWAICMVREKQIQSLLLHYFCVRLERSVSEKKVPGEDPYLRQSMQLLKLGADTALSVLPADDFMLRYLLPELVQNWLAARNDKENDLVEKSLSVTAAQVFECSAVFRERPRSEDLSTFAENKHHTSCLLDPTDEALLRSVFNLWTTLHR